AGAGATVVCAGAGSCAAGASSVVYPFGSDDAVSACAERGTRTAMHATVNVTFAESLAESMAFIMGLSRSDCQRGPVSWRSATRQALAVLARRATDGCGFGSAERKQGPFLASASLQKDGVEGRLRPTSQSSGAKNPVRTPRVPRRYRRTTDVSKS